MASASPWCATHESIQSLRRKSNILTMPSLHPTTSNCPLWLNVQQLPTAELWVQPSVRQRCTANSTGQDTDCNFASKRQGSIIQHSVHAVMHTIFHYTNHDVYITVFYTNTLQRYTNHVYISVFYWVHLLVHTLQVRIFTVRAAYRCTEQSCDFFFTFVWPCIVTNFFIIKPTRYTNFTNLFWHETLHVSDSSSVHCQEFIHCTLNSGICHTGTVHTALEQDHVLIESCLQTCMTYTIAECMVNKLLMRDRGTVWNI